MESRSDDQTVQSMLGCQFQLAELDGAEGENGAEGETISKVRSWGRMISFRSSSSKSSGSHLADEIQSSTANGDCLPRYDTSERVQNDDVHDGSTQQERGYCQHTLEAEAVIRPDGIKPSVEQRILVRSRSRRQQKDGVGRSINPHAAIEVVRSDSAMMITLLLTVLCRIFIHFFILYSLML
jgi:hypothetical protein